MASLRSNLVVSGLSMVLVGLIRPGFNATVNWVFGAAVNGRAATMIALIFLASLPATAGLPTIAVRHYARAVKRGEKDRAQGVIRLALYDVTLFAALGAALAIIESLIRDNASTPFGWPEGALVLVGVMSYSFWSLFKALLLAFGEAKESLIIETLSVFVFGAGLAAVAVLDLERWAVFTFVIPYGLFVLWTFRRFVRVPLDVRLDAADRRSFHLSTLSLFIGSASGLGARELTVLVLAQRVEPAAVGEVSVALSLLLILAFGPRILTMPLVNELSSFSGPSAEAEQNRLTEQAIRWLAIVCLAIGVGLVLVAEPLLGAVGNVRRPDVLLAFGMIALAFMSEMMITPAAMLLAVRVHASVLAYTGAASLAVAFLWWWFGPFGATVPGVVAGLALSHLVKAVGIGAFVRWQYGVRLVAFPVRLILAILVGLGLLLLERKFGLNAWLGALIFELSMLGLFRSELRAIAESVLRPKRRSAAAA